MLNTKILLKGDYDNLLPTMKQALAPRNGPIAGAALAI
jgi:hypothetical protein